MKNLTKLEEQVLLAVINSDYQMGNYDERINNPIWYLEEDDVNMKPRQLSGAISSCIKKGYVGIEKDGKGWVYGDLIRDYPHHATGLSIQQHGVIIHEVDKGTICQYTGIKDKNGVKIFEKDRVVGKDGVLGTVDMLDGSYVVRINNKLTVASLSLNERAVIGVTI